MRTRHRASGAGGVRRLQPVGSLAIDAVVLTMGDRPEALARCLSSIRRDSDVLGADPVVVWNGVEPSPTAGIREVALPENVGIPEGRNVGAAAGSCPLILFLDDDAELVGDGALRRAANMLAKEPAIAAVALRIVDPIGRTSRRHVPRLGGRSASRSGPATAFLGGAVLIRRAAFEEVGGYSGPLFYAMEETDLSWRLHDAGWSIHYAADLCVQHPRVDPSRHAHSRSITARNRVWIARRNLPRPVRFAYIANWLLIGLARSLLSGDRPTGLIEGTLAGLRDCPLPREPISWRTVVRLTRLGRPPIV